MTISAFSISGILAGVSSLLLGLLVLTKSSNKKIGRVWALFSISAGVWGFGGALIGSVRDPNLSDVIWRLTYALGVIWIGPFFYHFVSVFLETDRRRFILFNYLIASLFFFLVPTHLFFSRVDFVFNSFYYARAGLIYPIYLIWWISLVIISHIDMLRVMNKVSLEKQNQIRYFFLGVSIGFSGGCCCYFPNFGIDIYPWGNFLVTVYPIIMTYAILKYNLMDVRLFIRRAVLLLAIYLALILLTFPIIGFVHLKLIRNNSLLNPYLSLEVLLASLILSTGPFLYALFIKRSDFFHREHLAGLTHELKSPLASIQGALDMLVTEAKRNAAGSKQTEYLEMIERNSARLKNFIDDLLGVMKAGREKSQLELKSEDLSEICSSALHPFATLAQTKGIKLTQPTSTMKVHCDRKKIEQVISNLTSNALKFTDQGEIIISWSDQGSQVRVNVIDTGIGIEKDDLPHIFDCFYQGEEGKKAKGTGIGLAIAKTWIEAHGGTLQAESAGHGKGSQFWFTLPKSS
jgi:signal transduction histidine kinase